MNYDEIADNLRFLAFKEVQKAGQKGVLACERWLAHQLARLWEADARTRSDIIGELRELAAGHGIEL